MKFSRWTSLCFVFLLVLAAWQMAPASLSLAAAQPSEPTPRDLVGDWIFFEDRSPDRPEAQRRSNHGARFVVTLEGEVLIFESPRAGKPYRSRYALDGTPEVIEDKGHSDSHSARWKEGALVVSNRIDAPGKGKKREITVSEFRFTPTTEGLLIAMKITEPIQAASLCLYKREADVPMPESVAAKIDALAWLSGNWTGTMGKAVIEEHWSPIAGGAMLATSRTVSGSRMVAFEFLRIVERDGSLVYIAQPGGAAPTDFILTEISAERALFSNPRHDFPQRIVYSKSGTEGLIAEISDSSGKRAQRFEFKRKAP